MTLLVMVGIRCTLALGAIAAVVWASAIACSTSSVKPPVDLDPGDVDEDAGPISTTCFGPDAGCSGVTLCGPQVFLNQSGSTVPNPTGGTITPGVYSLTAYTAYDGKNGPLQDWARETFQIMPVTDAGADPSGVISYPWLDVSQSSAGPLLNAGGVLTTQATTIDFGFSCGLSQDDEATYSATATSITAYIVDLEGYTAALTYTLKQ